MEYSEQQGEETKNQILPTGVPGFDALFDQNGIPRRNAVLIAGGTGTGKSTFCRQVCYNLVTQGKHCMYVSFEESINRIERSMNAFGWDARTYIDSGQLLIQKINPLDILRMKFGSIGGSGSATELSYKIKPLIIPREFNPELIVVDSLTAVISASLSKEKNYRVYLQQLFGFFEETGATSFLVTETEPMPTRFSETGIEEFLADGIIVLYNISRGDSRESAIEVLKMRYSHHQKKIFAMEISPKGIIVHPDKQLSIAIK
ncbi:MAG: AAA family ATPase [Candidatus Thermoplasmatota archaeon]|nr:AAA family ATPase [Candidatus Thermoplasmatota archaeon]MBU1941453.1 AAA family ATPase [Candidatus Thermoplasmatota archaeon]